MNFIVSDPDQKAVIMEPHSMDGLHAIDIKKTGEYEMCIDNSFSTITSEYMFFVCLLVCLQWGHFWHAH